jgi:hypothetical protein
MTTLIELRRKHGVWPTLQEIGTAIDRLEAELDKLRLQMVTEVTDAEARSARLEAELERVNKYNEELFEYCEKIGGMGPGIQPPLDVVDEHRPAALSARQNGEGVGDG